MENQFREIIRQKVVDALAASPPALTHRDVRLPAVPGKAVAVIGMRRAGKTTFLWQVLADRISRGTDREGLLYFSFEDERLAGMTAGDLNLVVEEYYRLNPEWRDRRRATFFLDEIQSVPGWESFARRLLDSEQIDLFLSGSSARLLSREVATSMRGRASGRTDGRKSRHRSFPLIVLSGSRQAEGLLGSKSREWWKSWGGLSMVSRSVGLLPYYCFGAIVQSYIMNIWR